MGGFFGLFDRCFNSKLLDELTLLGANPYGKNVDESYYIVVTLNCEDLFSDERVIDRVRGRSSCGVHCLATPYG